MSCVNNMVKKVILSFKNKKMLSLTFATALLMMAFMSSLNPATAYNTTYNITYEMRGGTNNVNNQATSYDVADLPLRLATPSQLGYGFKFWVVECANGSYVMLPDSVIPVGTTGEITLVACWESTTVQHNIVYSLNGGTNNSYNPTGYYTEDTTINIINPTKSGSMFLGWVGVYSNATIVGPTTSFSIPSGTYGDLTLVACWM